MDLKNRVMGDQPNDFLHKIAGVVPGYHGYVDRERRRDADKLLRTQLARKYTAQRARLTGIQQSLLRHKDLANIGQIDHLAGVLQRFIDKLQNATYGYAGLFDPIKVEASDLDQLYAFDMALASGESALSGAVDSLESAATGEGAKAEMPAALDRLQGVINDLNSRFDQRADLLTSGARLPDSSYQDMLNTIQQPTGMPPATTPSVTPAPSQPNMGVAPAMPSNPETPRQIAAGGAGHGSGTTSASSGAGMGGIAGASVAGPMTTMSSAASMGNEPASGGEMARVSGAAAGMSGDSSMSSTGNPGPGGAPTMSTGGNAGIAGSGASHADAESPTASGPITAAADGMRQGGGLPGDEPSIASGGTPTTNISMEATMPPGPDVDSMAEGNQGFGGTAAGSDQGGSSPMALGGEAGTGIESASSPAVAPNAPGSGLVEGMGLANNMSSLGGSEVTSTGSSDLTNLNPGTSSTGAPGNMGGGPGSMGNETQS